MRKLVFVAVGTLALGFTALGCGGGSPSAPSTSGAVTIAITGQNGNLSFNPNPADAGGKNVVFKNNDSIVHHVQLNDGSADTGDIAPGATSKAIFIPAGGTNYHCTIHGTMVGAVTAQDDTPPPPCTGIYCSGLN